MQGRMRKLESEDLSTEEGRSTLMLIIARSYTLQGDPTFAFASHGLEVVSDGQPAMPCGGGSVKRPHFLQ